MICAQMASNSATNSPVDSFLSRLLILHELALLNLYMLDV